MAKTSNLSATRRTVRGLRAAERLTATEAGFAQLALTSAAALDDTLAADTAPYAVASLVRAHRDALATLADHAQVYEPDALDALLAAATKPTLGTLFEDG
jgi:hypothetical protein